MYDMGTNIMMDVIDQSIVTIKSCQPSSQITPFLFDIDTEPSISTYILQNNAAVTLFDRGQCYLRSQKVIPINTLPFHGTREVCPHGHGDASKSLSPTTRRTPAFESKFKETNVTIREGQVMETEAHQSMKKQNLPSMELHKA